MNVRYTLRYFLSFLIETRRLTNCAFYAQTPSGTITGSSLFSNSDDPEMLRAVEELAMLGIIKPHQDKPEAVKYDDEPRSHKEVLRYVG